ncbi:hypothetical protein QUF58_03105 [Anaerolineales bacterium HSG24]|nr:hypothetical protein [Anaerolineales bacterium HSG24]
MKTTLTHEEQITSQVQTKTEIILNYRILETNLGPLISHSRSSVYDVLQAKNKGHDLFRICVTYNLNPVQVQIALDYIEQHQQRLQVELKEILRQKAEQERYHKTIQAEVEQKIAQLPMTPERTVFYQHLRKDRLTQKTQTLQ